MAGTDVTPIVVALGDLASALDGDIREAVLTSIGMVGKEEAERAVRVESSKRGSLADLSMSGWRRGSPIKLGARFDVEGSTVTIAPAGRTKGPWRVLEEGRAGGGSFDMVLVGRARKDGTRRGRSRGRNVGGTKGKGTWSDAERAIEDEAPRVGQRTLEVEAQRRWVR